ncbi:glycosyltransferase family 4 protein [Oryzobacter telluris]|uniref:glycosyltransferase family 4 protein n=1 Tax=Oryzobacter telluris TaxID=3149179 RepID=UPI00370DC63C
MTMRVAIATESFLPTVNGVTTSVCRVAEQLGALGHEVLVVSPRPAPDRFAGHRVATVPSVSVRSFPTGLPTREVRHVLARFAPDVLHVASPFVLGARALRDAAHLGIPAVAVYQTDVPAYLAQHVGPVGPRASSTAWRWVRRVHSLAGRTLAPSRGTLDELRAHGVPRTALWARGVDAALFHPDRRPSPRVTDLRARLAPDGEVLVGYVGRLAPEKELGRLAEVVRTPGARLVVVGDGPGRDATEHLLRGVASTALAPEPLFLGHRSGTDLADAYAALDVFVHTGTRETFGQTLQEAAASGLPVVAPARGGPLDLVDHGRTGLLFDPVGPGSLGLAVARLVEDAALRHRMGDAGRERVAGRTWAVLTDELVGHYDAVRKRTALAA